MPRNDKWEVGNIKIVLGKPHYRSKTKWEVDVNVCNVARKDKKEL